jgi:FtsP/CotA-like multicopper oxidase with cupredoxin domain
MMRLLLKVGIRIVGTLLAVAVVVVAVAFGYVWLEKPSYPNAGLSFAQPLQIPPLLESKLEQGVKVFDLRVETGRSNFLPGVETETIGFNGAYLGPTLRVTKGDAVQVRVANSLGESVTVHWHGMDLPPSMDGGPHQEIVAAGSWAPKWTIINQAATLWYHSHMMGKTGEQVYRGLAGLFLIDDENASDLGLPDDYGVDDIPLIVQDRKFAPDGQFVYTHANTGGGLWSSGMMGETILVNGTFAPFLTVPATLVRLRLLNGSNARRYNFAFDDNRPFQQIASDGGLLATPVE